MKKNWLFRLHDTALAVWATMGVISLESCLWLLMTGADPFKLGLGIPTYLGVTLFSWGSMWSLVRYGDPFWREYQED